MMPQVKKTASEFLVLLISADVLFGLLHVLHLYTPHLRSADYSLSTERGFAEVFQYLKGYWIVILFAWLGFAKTRLYWGWALLFGYLVIDDAFSLHETGGRMIAAALAYQPMFGLRAQDLGELTVYALIGGGVCLMTGVAYRWGNAAFRRASRGLAVLLVLLAMFGAGADMLHSAMGRASGAGRLMGILEDGGEMLVMSVICWYGIQLLQQAHASARPRPADHPLLPEGAPAMTTMADKT